MCRDVADLGLMLSVIAGPDDRDPSSLPAQDLDLVGAAKGGAELTGWRVAYAGDLGGLFPLDPEVDRLARAGADAFAALGCRVEDACFDVADLREIIAGTRAFGMIARYADRFDRHEALMTLPLVNQITAALKVDARAITRAERLRTAYWHRARRFLERYDLIVAPTVGAPPFRLDQAMPSTVGGVAVERYYDVYLASYAFSVTGLPIAAVPCGFTVAGLPVGIQIVGRRQREDLVLRAAAAYQAARPEHFAAPRIDLDQARQISPDLVTTGMPIGSSA